MAKYSRDGDFTDPVVRCDSCSKITLTKELKRLGCCPNCGNALTISSTWILMGARYPQATPVSALS